MEIISEILRLYVFFTQQSAFPQTNKTNKKKLTALILCLRFLCHSQVIQITVKESMEGEGIRNDGVELLVKLSGIIVALKSFNEHEWIPMR